MIISSLSPVLTAQSQENYNKQLSSYDQRKQYRSGENLICCRIFDENLGKKLMTDFLKKKLKMVRQERAKTKFCNDAIARKIGSVLAKS